MHLTVLAVPGGPNAPLLTGRLMAVVEDHGDVSVSHQVISDEAAAVRWGMHGSQTLLIDGVDPFASPGQPASMSCRLFADEHGRLSGAPPAGQLRQAITRSLAAAARSPSVTVGRNDGAGWSSARAWPENWRPAMLL